MRRKKTDRAASKTAITVLSALCILLIAVSVLAPDATGPVYNITSVIVTPVQKGINAFGKWLSSATENLSDTSALREENERLQEQVDTLTAQASEYSLEKEELSRLQSLLELKEEYSQYETTGASVISRGSGNWYSTFTIDKGTSDGIAVDCNVISGSGLVGIVTQVGPNYAVVRSIIDDNSNVSAMVSTTSDTCIVEGSLELIDSGSLRLTRLRDEDNRVHVGDRVVTSSISEKFQPGILIGYISELSNNANNLTKSGMVTPVVDFAHIQEVLVIKDVKQYVATPDDTSRTVTNDVISVEEDQSE